MSTQHDFVATEKHENRNKIHTPTPTKTDMIMEKQPFEHVSPIIKTAMLVFWRVNASDIEYQSVFAGDSYGVPVYFTKQSNTLNQRRVHFSSVQVCVKVWSLVTPYNNLILI